MKSPLNQTSAPDAASSREVAAAVPGRLAGLASLALVGVVAAMLCSPFIFSVSSLSDEGVLLNGADRMLHGGRLYVDFFEFLPPGGFVITAAWLSLVGISLWSARILAILTITAIACFTYLACRLACRRASYPALVVIGWIVMTQGFWTQVNHHWFTTLFSMAAFWMALKSTGDRKPHLWEPLMAGLAAGTAVMVTPTRGALAMLAAAVAFVDLRGFKSRSIAYLAGCAVVPTSLLAYVVAQHALTPAFDDVILFPATRYASIQNVPFGYGLAYQNLPLRFLFPLLVPLTLFTYAGGWPASLNNRPLRVCTAFCLAGIIGIFPRPDMAHIDFAAPLAFPLLVYCARDLTQGSLRKYRGVAAILVVAVCIRSALAFLLTSEEALRAETVQTPRGPVAFLDRGPQGAKELVAWIETRPAKDGFFFYPYLPLVSFLGARWQVSKYEIFVPYYTSPFQYYESCISIMKSSPWIVIDRPVMDSSSWKMAFPAMQGQQPIETTRFHQVLNSQFELVARFGVFDVGRIIKEGNETTCAKIIE